MFAQKLRLGGTEIEFAHWVKRNNRVINANIAQKIVVKLLRFKKRNTNFQNPNILYGQNVFVNNVSVMQR